MLLRTACVLALLFGFATSARADIAVDPTLRQFGVTAIGVSNAMGFRIGNSGPGTITITSVSITGPAAGDFTLDAALAQPQVLPPNTEITSNAGLQFRPSMDGQRSATLTIESDAATPVVTIELRGYGFTPMLTLSADRVEFGDSAVGLLDEVTITASNLSTNAFAARLEVPDPFWTTTDILWLDGGETKAITFRVVPKQSGDISGIALLHLSDPPLALPVGARGVDINLAFDLPRGSVDLGTWPVGTKSRTTEVMLTNNSDQSIPIDRIATTNTAFLLEHAAPLDLLPGQSTEVEVVFDSVALGEAAGEIWVCVERLYELDDPACARPVTTLALRATGGSDGCSAGSRCSPWLLLLAVPLCRRRRRVR